MSEIRSQLSLEEEEQAARKLLLPELCRHLELASCAYNVIWKVLATFNDTQLDELSLPLKVRHVLLARLADDLRATELLCSLGYSVQACTVTASIFELAHTILFIDNDEKCVEEWLNHEKLTRSFKPIAEMVRQNILSRNKAAADDDWRREYDVYTQLCWMKHANPRLQGYREPHFWELHGTLNYAPDTTEEGVRRSWLSLQHAARL
jgi:hypothetical protein